MFFIILLNYYYNDFKMIIILINYYYLSEIILLINAVDPNNNGRIDCLINSTIGYSDPKNVYQCKQPMKCCFEYTKPSCCGRKPSIQIM